MKSDNRSPVDSCRRCGVALLFCLFPVTGCQVSGKPLVNQPVLAGGLLTAPQPRDSIRSVSGREAVADKSFPVAGLIEPSSRTDLNCSSNLSSEHLLQKSAALTTKSELATLVDDLFHDHAHYYSRESLTKLGIGFLVGGTMANTSIDQQIRRGFHTNVRGAESDEWSHGLKATKESGNGLYTLPLYAAAWAGGCMLEGQPGADAISEWGNRSLRTVIVGTPPMMAAQMLTGASRPGESPDDARWNPFQDDNGVSGHSFMGAVPFIAAAKMTDDPWLKSLYYAGSTLAPLSRVNDDAHYPSQALLGWWMAWIAATAVDTTELDNANWRIAPLTEPGTTGMTLEYCW